MAKTLAIVFGIVVIVVGVAGFFPNPLVGEGAIFATNALLNIVYIVLGIVLLAVAFMAANMSGLWLKIVGIVYLLLAVLGFLMVPDGGSLIGMLTVNMATNLLHAVLGVVLLVAGFVAKDGAPMQKMAAAPTSMPPTPPMGGSGM